MPTPRSAAAPDSLCASLLADHRQAEAALDGLEAALGRDAPDLAQAQRVFTTLSAELDTHFALEEHVLFPAVEPWHSMVLMEVEHDALLALRRALADALTAAVTTPDAPTLAALRQSAQAFGEALRAHIRREDQGIFPMCEQDIPPEDQVSLHLQMAALRQQARETPTPPLTRPARQIYPFQVPEAPGPSRPIHVQTLVQAEGLQIKVLTLQAGQTLAQHWTPYRLTLLCLQGRGVLESQPPAPPVPLTPGAGALLSPRLLHALRAESEGCQCLLLFDGAPRGPADGISGPAPPFGPLRFRVLLSWPA